MFRVTSRSLNLLRSASRSRIDLQTRNASSDSGGSGVKLALISGTAALSVAGGTLGYAGIDPEFRAYVEENVPGAKDVFSSILGPPDSKPEQPAVPPSKMKIPKVDRLPVTSKPQALPPPPAPPIDKPEVLKVDVQPEPLPVQAELPKMPPKPLKEPPKATVEKKPTKKGVPVEKKVKELKVALEMAALAGEQCVEAIAKHGKLVVSVLEQNSDVEGDKAWHDVIEAANAKSKAVKAAQDRVHAVQGQLDKLASLVDKDEAEVANKEVAMAQDELREIRDKISVAKKDSYLIEQYRDLVDEGRQQFRKELAGILPDSKQGLTEEEMNVFVTHAYQKVCGLQQQLAKLRLLQQQLDRSSMSDKQLRTEQVVQVELEAQKRQLDVEHQQRLVGIREEMEAEMRSQMRRQAAAHSDHVKDSLEIQEKEISRKLERKLDEALAEERAKYRGELSKLNGAVDALKTALKDQSNTYATVKDAQELWLACSSLQRALEAARPSSGLLPLQKEVKAIQNAMGQDGDPFVDAIISSLPSEATMRGVYTDQTLRDRFFKVEQVAKRTALIGEDGGSPILYLLSYLQSLFVLTPCTSQLPDASTTTDLESLNTFDIMWLARGCVERGDFEQAVKYMTLLKGEPKKVSSDWMSEARLLLETKQVCNALMSHAAAFGLEALPSKG